MRLTLAIHHVTDMSFGKTTKISGTHLEVNKEELREQILEDKRLKSVDIEIARPGENCRIGFIYDVLEPRAKEPGTGPDFPGIVSPLGRVGSGTTNVLRGALVSAVDEHGGFIFEVNAGRGGMKMMEMSGAPADASPFGKSHHLVIVTHAQPTTERYSALNALRKASVKAAVYLAKTAVGKRPASQEIFDLPGPGIKGREGLPRIGYIGGIHGHQFGTDPNEHILYGSSCIGYMPVPLHPNEWLDGAVVISYGWNPGVDTFFYQNHPIIKELYRRHNAGEITFVGTVAYVGANLEEERDRNTMLAASVAQWCLGAEGLVITRYSISGAQHSDMFETARQAENFGIATVVQPSDMAPDRRAESVLLMNIPEVRDVVIVGNGSDITWKVPPAERVIAGSPEAAKMLATLKEMNGFQQAGVLNHQGGSKLASTIV